MEICIDFDGTCVTHEYPNIGRSIGAMPVLRDLQDSGHQLILFTMRSGKELAEAVIYLEQNGIVLYGINSNPTQREWTASPKAYGQLYIDDAALGAPLVNPSNPRERPYIDWSMVRSMLVRRGVL